MLYFWVLIRKKSRVREFAIYSMADDGSINDCEEVVVLSKDEDIDQYVREHYWNLLGDFIKRDEKWQYCLSDS